MAAVKETPWSLPPWRLCRNVILSPAESGTKNLWFLIC